MDTLLLNKCHGTTLPLPMNIVLCVALFLFSFSCIQLNAFNEGSRLQLIYLTNNNDSIQQKNISSSQTIISTFNVKAEGEQVHIIWNTEKETDNKGFDLQTSIDGKHWKSIVFLNGGGTTENERNYKYSHYPNNKTIHYRLRQVNWNGDFYLSDVKTIELDKIIKRRFVEARTIVTNRGEIQLTFPEGLDLTAFYILKNYCGDIIDKGAIDTGEGFYTTKIRCKKLMSGKTYILTIKKGSEEETFELTVL